MKKLLSFILVLALCLSICACESGKKITSSKKSDNDDNDDNNSVSQDETTEPQQEPSDILIGKWETITDGETESILEFTMDDDIINGKWTIYDYADRTWAEHTFTVKERTDDSITLLLSDGTLSVDSYTMLEHALFFDGELYYNSELTLPDVENDARLMLHNGNIYRINDNIYIGMHYDFLKAAYPEITGLSEYNYASLDSLGEFDSVLFSFTENGFLRSVHLSEYDADTMESLKESFIQYADAEFGEHTFRTRQDENNPHLYYDYYEWELDVGSIQLSESFEEGKTSPNRVSVAYYNFSLDFHNVK